MNKIEQWFDEAKNVPCRFSFLGVESIIYKGFKISKVDGIFMIYDVRFGNLYSKVKACDMALMDEHGFIKGADIISFNRDEKRINFYKKKAEREYDRRKVCEKELKVKKDIRLNKKRIRNINRRIDIYIDCLFLYRTRVNQYKIKYNLN